MSVFINCWFGIILRGRFHRVGWPTSRPVPGRAAIPRPQASPTLAPWGSVQFKAAGLAQLSELELRLNKMGFVHHHIRSSGHDGHGPTIGGFGAAIWHGLGMGGGRGVTCHARLPNLEV